MTSVLQLPRLSRIRAAARTLADRLGPQLAVGLLAAAAVGLVLIALATGVHRGDTQPFDEAARKAVQVVASPPATALIRRLTDLGSGYLLTPATLACAFLFLRRKRIRGAILLTVTMIGAWLLNWLLKLAFARARPEPFFGLTAPSSYSFPSGHALAAFCFYGALAALLAVRVRSRGLRVVIWTLAGLTILGVGFSRVYLGVHYATDVLAGFGVGFVWVLAVASADRVLRRGDRRGPREAAAERPPA